MTLATNKKNRLKSSVQHLCGGIMVISRPNGRLDIKKETNKRVICARIILETMGTKALLRGL